MSYRLLVIDPQVDFHEGGNLAVAGATADSANIMKLISEAPPAEVFVSLDTHTPNHIGHSGFWSPEPTPFTFFKVDTGRILGGSYGQIFGSDAGASEYTPKDTSLLPWALYYVENLPKTGRGVPLIWPMHCLETNPGHAVHAPLKATLDAISETINVEYHIKGQNEASEMYSIFAAELPVEEHMDLVKPNVYSGLHADSVKTSSKITESKTSDVEDGAYLTTTFNTGLFDSLTKDDLPVVICGEALSHCVNWSTRDFASMLSTKGKKNTVIVLIDGSSAVGTFEHLALAFFSHCFTTGVRLMSTAQCVAFLNTTGNSGADVKESENKDLHAKIVALGGKPEEILKRADGVWPQAGGRKYKMRTLKKAKKAKKAKKSRRRF